MLAFIRYNKNLTNNALFVRYRNLTGHYYDFVSSTWVFNESANTKKFLFEIVDSDPYESTYSREIVLPVGYDENTIYEIVVNSTGEVLGNESILPYSKLSRLTFDDQDNVVVSSIGAIVLPTLTGAAYAPTVTYGTLLKIVQYDTPTLNFNLNSDYTAWEVKLYYKSENTGVVFVKDCTWINATIGHATVEFTSNETRNLGTFQCELKITKNSIILTVMKFTLAIQEGLTV